MLNILLVSDVDGRTAELKKLIENNIEAKVYEAPTLLGMLFNNIESSIDLIILDMKQIGIETARKVADSNALVNAAVIAFIDEQERLITENEQLPLDFEYFIRPVDENLLVRRVISLGKMLLRGKEILKPAAASMKSTALKRIGEEIEYLAKYETELKSMLEKAADIIWTIEDIDCCSILIKSIDAENGLDFLYAARGVSDKFICSIGRAEVEEKMEELIKNNRVYYLENVTGRNEEECIYFEEGIKTAVFIPVSFKNSIIGAVNYASKNVKAFDDGVKELLDEIAYRIGVGLERIITEQKLDSSNRILKFAVDVNGDIIWEYDAKTRKIRISENFSEQFGYYGEEMPDSPEKLPNILHPEEYDLLRVVISEHLRAGSHNYILEQRIKTGSGGYKWVLHRGKVIEVDKQGNVGKMIGTLTDITFIKEIQQALLAAKQEAEAASKVKNLFLANMSHELRTPMNGIFGMIQLLEVIGINEDQKECIGIMKEAGKRMISLINNLIDLTTIEAGKTRINELEIDIKEFAKDVLVRYKAEAESKGINMEYSITAGVPDLFMGDYDKIKTILCQFVDNAIKFTEKGRVELVISRSDISTDGDRYRLMFSVKDTGIGFGSSDRDKLFRSFSQLDDSYTKRFQGAGLGLAIAKKLAEAICADIEVDSIPGEGSAFTLVLDAKANKESLLGQNITSKKVLIADDDETSRVLLGILCDKAGIKAEFAEDGAKAVKLHEENSFDIIFMDIQMPQLSGISAAKAIRGIDLMNNRKTVIIAVTAYALKGDRERFIQDGMDDYLSKPVDSQNFIELIEKWLKD